MKKMIRITLLVLMIAGVFIFAPGERVAASTNAQPGITFYSYTASDDTHEIDIQNLVTENLLIYANGELIYDHGISHEDYMITIQNDITIYNITLDEVDVFLSDFSIGNYLGNNYVIIVVDPLIYSSNLQTYSYLDEEEFSASDLYRIVENLYNGQGNGSEVIISNGIDLLSQPDVVIETDSNGYILINTSTLDTYFRIFDDFYLDQTFGYRTIAFESITPEPIEYTITFNANGGSAVDPIVVTEGALLGETIWDPSVETTKEGYTFDDWYKNAGLTIPVNESDIVTADITLYAGWIENIVNYTVTFNTNGGSYIAPAVVQAGNTVTQPTDPQKVGYVFDGWYEEMFFLNVYDFQDTVEDNITLYAKWALAEDEVDDESEWDVFMDNLPWIILGIVFIAIIFKK